MQTFLDWLSYSDIRHRLWLIETYFSFDAGQYNRLFDDELGKLRAVAPGHQEAIERMRGFNWVGYIAKSVRNAGYRDQREVQERTHDVAVKMLTGGLFRDYDERRHGTFDLRFKRATAIVTAQHNPCRHPPQHRQPHSSVNHSSSARVDPTGTMPRIRPIACCRKSRRIMISFPLLDAGLDELAKV